MPATGSVAVQHALAAHGVGTVVGHHKTPECQPELVRRSGFDPETFTVATTVRDPIQWFTSMWRKGILGSHDLNSDPITVEWVKKFENDGRWFNGTDDLWWKYVPFANVIWFQETLQGDIDRTMRAIGAPKVTLEKANASHWKVPSWTPAAEKYVRDKYGDLSRFDIHRATTY